MPLQWTQEPRFAARGTTGKFYKIFPFSNSDKFAATVTHFDDNGNLVTEPIGGQFDTVEEAQAACEKEMLRASTEVKV